MKLINTIYLEAPPQRKKSSRKIDGNWWQRTIALVDGIPSPSQNTLIKNEDPKVSRLFNQRERSPRFHKPWVEPSSIQTDGRDWL